MPPVQIDRTLDFPIYGTNYLSRLTGLHPQRIRRWLIGYEYRIRGSSRIQPPVITRGDAAGESRASFLDLVELLYANAFLEAGLTLQAVRKALLAARDHFSEAHPFAHKRFFVMNNREVFLEVGEGATKAMISLLHKDQFGIAPIVLGVGRQIDFDPQTGIAKAWRPLSATNKVVLDPHFAFGQPTVTGTGIKTSVVYDLYLSEGENVKRVSDFLGVSASQVDAAVALEKRLAA